MHHITLFPLYLLSLIQLGAAQIPECAKSCVDDASKKVCPTSSSQDLACACTPGKNADIINDATSCVIAACGSDVAINEVLPAANVICAAYSASVAASSVVASVTGAAPISITNQATVANPSAATTRGPTISETTNPAEATQTTISSTSSPPTAGLVSHSSSSGLKPGTIAGITIGAVAIIALIILAIFFILRRRRKHEPSEPPGPGAAELEAKQISELEARHAIVPYHDSHKPELEATVYPSSPTEINTREQLSSPVELEGARARISSPSELSGYEHSRSEMEAGPGVPPQEIYTRSPAPQLSAPVATSPSETYYRPPAPQPAVISATGTESPEELERLAEEERRLDAEIVEAERLRDLRSQRARVQERLARARGGIT